jgi:nucleoside-diphosphate-sugar epimerase
MIPSGRHEEHHAVQQTNHDVESWPTTGTSGLQTDAYRGVPALVLGGSGFIGAWTTRALVARGAVVTVVARDPVRAATALAAVRDDVRILARDLADPTALDPLVDIAKPAIVFNLAGYGVDASERDPRLMAALNAELVEALCVRMARASDDGWRGVRLVQAGSALEYGTARRRLEETMPVHPTTEYGRTKLQGTRAIGSAGNVSGLHAVVARLFTVYGPGEHEHRLLPSLMRAARTGERLALTSGRQPRDFTYVGDVAEGLLRLGVSRAAGTVVNLATARLATVREFAETAAAVIGLDPSLLEFGRLPEREDEMWHGEVDVSRLQDLTSWVPPTSLAEGIRRTWELRDAA